MLNLFVTIIWVLIAICCLVGLYYLVVYVLDALGIPIPPMVLKICMLILGLLILLWLVTALFGGGFQLPNINSGGRMGHGELILVLPSMVA